DCLAFVGQPMPHEPRFQHPFTLRWITADAMPSLSAPRRSNSLFSFGAVSHGPMFSRRSACSNHGAIAASVISPRPKCSRQYCRVGDGVRKELVQLTVVEPPTQRPCRMLIALSALLRVALSWYSDGYASLSRWWKSLLLLSGPSSTRTTSRPARVSNSAVMPAPAPVPTMATSQRR